MKENELPEIGSKWKLFYNENNINNRECIEIRGVVDDYFIYRYTVNRDGEQYFGYEMKFLEYWDRWTSKGFVTSIE